MPFPDLAVQFYPSAGPRSVGGVYSEQIGAATQDATSHLAWFFVWPASCLAHLEVLFNVVAWCACRTIQLFLRVSALMCPSVSFVLSSFECRLLTNYMLFQEPEVSMRLLLMYFKASSFSIRQFTAGLQASHHRLASF